MNRTLLRVAAAAVAFAVVLTAVPFVVATTFFGDDHLFLTFARHVSNPLAAFVRDHHGGEFYRPLPMCLWWILARLADGAAFPFAAAGFVLHAAVAVQAGLLLLTVGEDRRTAALASLLFFLAPQTLDAAYWYSASTDLLATAAALAALIFLCRGRSVIAAGLAVCAYLSKEAALILPFLGLVVLARRDGAGRRAHLLAVAPLFALAAASLAVRWVVLGGWGGAGDARASLPAKLLQLASGVTHLLTGSSVVPEPLAWLGGGLLVALVLVDTVPRRRGGDGTAFLPVIFVAAALVPLLAADWAVGARYFYLPSVGLVWLGARALRPRPPATQVLLFSAMLGLGAAQAMVRHHDVNRYKARLTVAGEAVRDGVGRGHTVFHVTSGIKDLDLALKATPALRPFEPRLLILSDVPASFVVVPPVLESSARFLLATPPIPPSGAYRFGDRAIVGLPRRGDEPALDQVVANLPQIRFIRLVTGPGGRLIARDATDQVRRSLE